MNKILVILLWIVLGLFYWWIKTTHLEQCCTQNMPISEAISSDKKLAKTPYYFNSNLDSVYVDTNSFLSFINGKISGRNEGDTIQITGWRYSNESESNNGIELGLYRAQKMSDYLNSINIKGPFKLSSVLLGDKEFSGRWYNPDMFSLLEKSESDIKIANRHLMYHEYGQSHPIMSTETSNYLDLAAERVIASGETIIVTGHTDASGSSGFNKTLSLKRANKVAEILISKGVLSSQIQIKGNGETDPINTTNSDNQNKINRRTTLEITK